jgi:hypothetical protein
MYCLKIQRHNKINGQNFEQFNPTLKSMNVILKNSMLWKTTGHKLKTSSEYLLLKNYRNKIKHSL